MGGACLEVGVAKRPPSRYSLDIKECAKQRRIKICLRLKLSLLKV